MITSTQELRHLTRKFVKLAVEYLRAESPILLSMETWPHHIDRFERQYEKAFAKDPPFGAYLMDHIHKRVQVFLHSCNKTAMEDVELGALAEFGGI